MLQRMEAEILFLDPDDMGPGSVALVDHGFEVEVLVDRIDDYSPAVDQRQGCERARRGPLLRLGAKPRRATPRRCSGSRSLSPAASHLITTAPLARAASSTPTREGQMAEHEPCIGKTSNGFTPKS